MSRTQNPRARQFLASFYAVQMRIKRSTLRASGVGLESASRGFAQIRFMRIASIHACSGDVLSKVLSHRKGRQRLIRIIPERSLQRIAATAVCGGCVD